MLQCCTLEIHTKGIHKTCPTLIENEKKKYELRGIRRKGKDIVLRQHIQMADSCA